MWGPFSYFFSMWGPFSYFFSMWGTLFVLMGGLFWACPTYENFCRPPCDDVLQLSGYGDIDYWVKLFLTQLCDFSILCYTVDLRMRPYLNVSYWSFLNTLLLITLGTKSTHPSLSFGAACSVTLSPLEMSAHRAEVSKSRGSGGR